MLLFCIVMVVDGGTRRTTSFAKSKDERAIKQYPGQWDVSSTHTGNKLLCDIKQALKQVSAFTDLFLL